MSVNFPPHFLSLLNRRLILGAASSSVRLTGPVNLSSLWAGDPLGPVGSVPCLATQTTTSAEVTCKNSARLSRLAHSEASLARELIGAD